VVQASRFSKLARVERKAAEEAVPNGVLSGATNHSLFMLAIGKSDEEELKADDKTVVLFVLALFLVPPMTQLIYTHIPLPAPDSARTPAQYFALITAVSITGVGLAELQIAALDCGRTRKHLLAYTLTFTFGYVFFRAPPVKDLAAAGPVCVH